MRRLQLRRVRSIRRSWKSKRYILDPKILVNNYVIKNKTFFCQVCDKIDSLKLSRTQSNCCSVFFKDKVVQSMVIFCTGGHTFPIHNLTSESEVIFNLLAVYNVFDGQYPAAHGFLSLIHEVSVVYSSINRG